MRGALRHGETMEKVDCLYCGKRIAEDLARCPHCDAPSHFQRRGFRVGARSRFILLFSLLVVVVFFFALWLPR